MSADDFLDSNVLVYSVDLRFPAKRAQAKELIDRSITDNSGCISYQVIQETLNVLSGKLGVPGEQIRELLDDALLPLWTVNPTASLYRSALSLRGRRGFSFYDSLIAAAALEEGCQRLYSEDLQHGQQIQGLTILNLFQGPKLEQMKASTRIDAT